MATSSFSVGSGFSMKFKSQLQPDVEKQAKIHNLFRVAVSDHNQQRKIYIDEQVDFGEALTGTKFHTAYPVGVWRILYEKQDASTIQMFTDAVAKWAESKGLVIGRVDASPWNGSLEDALRQMPSLAGNVVTLITDDDKRKLKMKHLCVKQRVAHHVVTPEEVYRAPRDPSVLHTTVNKMLVAVGGVNYVPQLDDIRPELRLENMLVVGYEVVKYHTTTYSDVVIGYSAIKYTAKGKPSGAWSGSFLANNVLGNLKDLMCRLVKHTRDVVQKDPMPQQVLLLRGIDKPGQDKNIKRELKAFREACQELKYQPKITLILVIKPGVKFSKDFFERLHVGQGIEFKRNTHLNTVRRAEFVVYAHHSKQRNNTNKTLPLYQIVQDDAELSAVEAMSLMRQLCYCHQNLTQAIRYPDPVRKAEKKVEFAKNLVDDEIEKRLYERRGGDIDAVRLNIQLQLR